MPIRGKITRSDHLGTVHHGHQCALLAIPITSTSTNLAWLLPFTCVSLLIIALGNGFSKATCKPSWGRCTTTLRPKPRKAKRLKRRKTKSAGFQIFYVFINIGALAPRLLPPASELVAGMNDLTYNAALPELCHKFINSGGNLVGKIC